MIDWNSAPEWAIGHGYTPATQSAVWIGLNKYQYLGGDKNTCRYDNPMSYPRDAFYGVTMRPQEWPTDEQRIDVIGSNGNDGVHYAPDWSTAPEGTEYYGQGKFWKSKEGSKIDWFYDPKHDVWCAAEHFHHPELAEDYQVRPDSTSRTEPIVTAIPPANKYDRTIIGKYGTGSVTVDVYRVLNAFGPLSPGIDHSVKKLLAAGTRGAKSERQDLLEAIQSIEARLQYLEVRDGDVK